MKKLVIHNSPEELKQHSKIKESMFPPTLEEAEKMQLQNTMKMFPHDQNSGGFFLALLKKHEDFEWNYNLKSKK